MWPPSANGPRDAAQRSLEILAGRLILPDRRRCVCLLPTLALALVATLAEGKLQRAVACLEPGLLEGPLERFRISLQHGQRVDPIDKQVGFHTAVIVEIEPDVDAAILFGVKPNLEALRAFQRPHADLEGQHGKRCGRGLGHPWPQAVR